VSTNPDAGPQGKGYQSALAFTLEARNTVQAVAHTLRGDGFDASEDGTGRGTPLVAVHAPVISPALKARDSKGPSSDGDGDGAPLIAVTAVHAFDARQNEVVQYGQITGPLDTDGGSIGIAFALRGREEGAVPEVEGDGSAACALRAASGGSSRDYIAFTAKDHGADADDEVSPTLRSGGHDASHANGGVMPAVAFSMMPMNSGRDFKARKTDVSQPIMAGGPTGGNQGGDDIATTGRDMFGVRRLTPTECARLQGFPDDHLSQVPWRGKARPADGPMYKAFGNSMAVNVLHYLGERIQLVESLIIPDVI
jgi:DNA (cytosine-5)-methyltransferase 1